MTPAAHVAAAIEVMDDILAGHPAERVLAGWGRSHRFAGSKDRAAIRDLVFQALRCRASYGWLGGAQTGRGILIGAMREAGRVDEVFTGVGHAPAPIEGDPAARHLDDAPRAIRCDLPEWLLPYVDAALGAQADAVLGAMRQRAGVFLRVNIARSDRETAAAALADEGVETRPVEGIKTALQVIAKERFLSRSKAFMEGLVEVQDPASQRAMDLLEIPRDKRVLDYCAGGGGKSLALAARGAAVTAYDIDPRRMSDIAPRAARAGVTIATIDAADLTGLAPFDLVVVDAPCSGSGTWRRTPEAKWALTPARLTELCDIQAEVLRKAASHVAPGGYLAYATCSVFEEENEGQVAAFLRGSGWTGEDALRLPPGPANDGFFLQILQRLT